MKNKIPLEVYTFLIGIAISIYAWIQRSKEIKWHNTLCNVAKSMGDSCEPFSLSYETRIIFLLAIFILTIGIISSVIKWYRRKIK